MDSQQQQPHPPMPASMPATATANIRFTPAQDGGAVGRQNSFELVISQLQGGHAPPGSGQSQSLQQRRLVIANQESSDLILPRLPSLSTSKTGNIIIISNDHARREALDYACRAWERCRDPLLPWRERLRDWKRTVYCSVQFPEASAAGRCIRLLLTITIFVNVCTLIAASFPLGLYQPATCVNPVCTPAEPGAQCSEIVCPPEEKSSVLWVNAAVVAVLTIDYLARLGTIHAVPASVVHSEALAIDLQGNLIDTTPRLRSGGWRLTWEYACSFMGVVDLLNVGVLAAMHFSRSLRLLKLLRYSRQTSLFARTLQASYPALIFFALLSGIILLMIASITYFLERGEFRITAEEPSGAYYRRIPGGDGFQISPFKNILIAFYYTIVSTTTLKQADLTVSSPASRCISVVLAYMGIVLVALPLSIISQNFKKQYALLLGNEGPPASDRPFFAGPGPRDDYSDKV